jgi:hypothetical protein
MEVSAQLHASAALPPGKSPLYPFDTRLGESQSRSGHDGDGKNFQSPPGIEPQNPNRPARSPSLYRLSYHGSLLDRRGELKVIKYFEGSTELHLLFFLLSVI